MGDSTFLPFLPGYTFTDPSKTRFAVSQTLHHIKGCPVPTILPKTSTLEALELLDTENKMWDNTMVELTYGPKPSNFQTLTERPHVAFDRKVLHFFAYMREDIYDWPSEEYRIRPVNIYYYLTDDTLEIVEPKVQNSGITQGVMIRRHKFPHPDGNRFWHWKDLNLGMNLLIYGKKFRLTRCDPWTSEYYTSGGMILNPEEPTPEDPHHKKRREAQEVVVPETLPVEEEKLCKFLNYDRHVLRFYGMWDDTLNIPSEMRKVIVLFYLSDDTIEVQEVHRPNDGRDPYAVLIHRQKIPVDINDLPPTFPRSVLETTAKEVKRYFGPQDMAIGKTIRILNRKILLYDCDEYTKSYYRHRYGIQDFAPIDVEAKPLPKVPLCIPPHSGYGTWEDSLQSCFSLRPQPPKKDVLKFLNFDDKFLRYKAYIDTVWPIDRSRRFIITFFPGDDTVSIREPFVPNSGIPSGAFMKRKRLVKGIGPGDKPQYYQANDFYIGATIEALGRRFIITDADRYVLTFMEQNHEMYPESAFEAHRSNLVETNLSAEPMRTEKDRLMTEMRAEVVKHCGEGETPLPKTLDLGEGLVPKEVLIEKFYSANLPISKDLLDRAMTLCTAPNQQIDVDELKKILLFSFGCFKTV